MHGRHSRVPGWLRLTEPLEKAQCIEAGRAEHAAAGRERRQNRRDQPMDMEQRHDVEAAVVRSQRKRLRRYGELRPRDWRGSAAQAWGATSCRTCGAAARCRQPLPTRGRLCGRPRRLRSESCRRARPGVVTSLSTPIPRRSATVTAGPVSSLGDQDRLGADVGQIEIELVGPIGRVERRGRSGCRDRDECRRHLRPVRQHDGDAIAAADAARIQLRRPLQRSAGAGRHGSARSRSGAAIAGASSEPRQSVQRSTSLQTTRTSMSPTPSIWPCRTSPRLTAPTPAGVPERMMSPGISVNRPDR